LYLCNEFSAEQILPDDGLAELAEVLGFPHPFFFTALNFGKKIYA
jgi:hypothetical protein